ncbi:MAG: glycosyltransferase [Acidimicrobiales bacterium]
MVRRTIVVHLGDQRRARTDSHGIINFSLGLVAALPGALRDDERLIVQVNDELAPELGRAFLRPGDEVRTIRAPRSILARLWVDHVSVSRLAREVGADVVLYPKGFLPLTSRLVRARHVPCLHDDIPTHDLRDRELSWRRRVRSAYFTALVRWSLRRADLRLFVSAFTERALATRWGSARPGDAVVHEGITLPRVPVVPVAERHPRVVVLGSRHRHKRVDAGLALIAGDPTLQHALEQVLVIGPLDARTQVGRLPIDHRAGPLASSELAECIASSRLLVYPSRYEGFGLPPLEALALGTPVVYRRTGAAQEVLDDVPGGFDDEEAAAFGRAVVEALALDDDRLRVLSDRVWARFNWTLVADRVAAALRTL